MDSLDIVGLTLLIFNYFIFVPMLMYGLYLFIKSGKTQNDMISNRNNTLTYAIHLFVIIGTLTERTFLLTIRVWNIIPINYLWIEYTLYSIFWCAVLDLFTIKVYILYFKQQYNISIADKTWKQNINPNNADWYIKNKNTFGNIKYLIKISFIPYLISCILTGLIFPLCIGEGLLLDFTILTLAAIPIFIAFVIFWKAKSLNDIYFIRNEILYQCIFIAFVLIVYMIIFLVCHFNEYFLNNYPVNTLRFEWASYIVLTDGVAAAICMIPTYYTHYLISRNKMEILLFELERSRSEETSTDNTNNRLNRIHINLQNLNKIISRYNSFKLFISYLVSEFSTQNLLFLIELIQCKHAYQQKNNFVVTTCKTMSDTKTFMIIDFNINPFADDAMKVYKTEKEKYFTYLFNSDGSIMTKLLLPTEIPKTIILTEYSTLSKHMKALYNKYVKTASDFELNISYSTRQKLQNIFNDNNIFDECQYFNVLDECGIEIASLLQQPLARFINTNIMETIIDQFNDDKLLSNDASLKKLLNSDKIGILRREVSVQSEL